MLGICNKKADLLFCSGLIFQTKAKVPGNSRCIRSDGGKIKIFFFHKDHSCFLKSQILLKKASKEVR